ncbi:MAG: hypothetical protein ISN29_02530 [Gammaproteobacteria bacterium AqS3]|nr:hypothetical protein [Gammaproteobacteria bacterium AqS3]
MTVLDRSDMIAEFEIQGFTAIPHPFVKEWIAMPLHHKVEAQHIADHHGWESVPMGWKPKTVAKKMSCKLPRR